MKTNKLNNFNLYTGSKRLTLGLALASLLGACGGEDIPVTPINAAPASFCQPPVGQYLRTVHGNFGMGGAVLTLDIFVNGTGRIAAIGELSIPSLESLYGIDNTFGITDPNLTPVQGSGYTGAHTPIRACVGTQGFTGDLDRDRAYQDINLTLYGDFGTYIEMGTTVGPVQAYLVNENIEGSVKLRVGNYPQNVFTLTR